MALGDIITAPIQNILVLNPGSNTKPDILHIAGNVFAISLFDAPVDGQVRTYNVSNDGIITYLANVALVSQTLGSHIVHHAGNNYAITCNETLPHGTGIYVEVVGISPDGLTLNHLAGPYLFEAGNFSNLIQIAPNYYANFYHIAAGPVVVYTFSLSDNGLAFNLLTRFVLDALNCVEIHALHITGDVYASVYQEGVRGRIRTTSISPDGAAIANIDTVDFDAAWCRWPRLCHVAGNIYVITYSGPPIPPGQTGWLQAVEILPTGAITLLGNLNFDTACDISSPILLGLNTIAIFYQAPGTQGSVITIDAGDGTAPAIDAGPVVWVANCMGNNVARLPGTNVYALAHERTAPNPAWLATFSVDSGYPPIVLTDPATGVT